ncbi:hypothetical protein B0J18DRAFT_306076 [Chaetomium sp. MPI-SDFR-AT-0129]|nr:hypothetical protein B0J18DRAFT_306076 [Chaetomium sp. MPI-SDFR-AT-0129]
MFVSLLVSASFFSLPPLQTRSLASRQTRTGRYIHAQAPGSFARARTRLVGQDTAFPIFVRFWLAEDIEELEGGERGGEWSGRKRRDAVTIAGRENDRTG